MCSLSDQTAFFLAAMFLMLAFGGGAFLFERADLAGVQKRENELVVREAAILGTHLSAEINSTFYLVQGLAALFESNPDQTEAQFHDLAGRLFSARPGLRSIAFAPDFVIRHIYPVTGNEAALGLDYRDTPAQFVGVERASRSGKPVIAGPLTLVQGGEAIVGRFPVFRTNENEEAERTFWAMLSTPVDLAGLYERVGLREAETRVRVALRSPDAVGLEGGVFYGDARLFSEPRAVFEVPLISGGWEIAAEPLDGWTAASPMRWVYRGTAGVLVLLLLGLMGVLSILNQRTARLRDAEILSEQVKHRFLTNMSHEIRTPLNGIQGLAGLLETSIPDATQRTYARNIFQCSRTLEVLLDDMLQLSDVSAGTAPVHQPVELAALVGELLELLRIQADEKGVALLCEIDPHTSGFRSDPRMLRQIFWNLLSNALKFTPSGHVSFQAKARTDETGVCRRVVVTIADSGVGIDHGKAGAIFEAFVQEDNSDTRRFGGAGLGLAVVKRYVDLLGGTVSVASEKGKGSRFTVEVPGG
ncbi:MAG: CHASE domain-containing protein [Opitutales bacterium]|nr:CHASE domain-containing protein [Opitutales bacterium]